jgi:hypothetical protein
VWAGDDTAGAPLKGQYDLILFSPDIAASIRPSPPPFFALLHDKVWAGLPLLPYFPCLAGLHDTAVSHGRPESSSRRRRSCRRGAHTHCRGLWGQLVPEISTHGLRRTSEATASGPAVTRSAEDIGGRRCRS